MKEYDISPINIDNTSPSYSQTYWFFEYNDTIGYTNIFVG